MSIAGLSRGLYIMSKWMTSVCGYGFFFFSSRRRHTRCSRDWSSDVCSSDLELHVIALHLRHLVDQLGVVVVGEHRGILVASSLDKKPSSGHCWFHAHIEERNHQMSAWFRDNVARQTKRDPKPFDEFIDAIERGQAVVPGDDHDGSIPHPAGFDQKSLRLQAGEIQLQS